MPIHVKDPLIHSYLLRNLNKDHLMQNPLSVSYARKRFHLHDPREWSYINALILWSSHLQNPSCMPSYLPNPIIHLDEYVRCSYIFFGRYMPLLLVNVQLNPWSHHKYTANNLFYSCPSRTLVKIYFQFVTPSHQPQTWSLDVLTMAKHQLHQTRV